MDNLLIKASPRERGFSQEIISLVSQNKSFSFELIDVYKKEINPCLHCDFCKKEPKCIWDDDMNLIYEQIKKANHLIIVSPIYFLGLPSPLKALVDRTQVFWNNPLKKEKKAAVLLIADQKNENFMQYYQKNWEYILLNLGIKDFFFKLLGEIQKVSDSKKENVVKEMFSFFRGSGEDDSV